MFDHAIGALSGIIAGIFMGLISMTLFRIGICKLCIIAIGGGIFTGQLVELQPYGLIIAWLTHLSLSAAFGILITIVLNHFGSKYHVLTGAVLLTLIYLANIGIIAPLRGTIPDDPEYFDLLLILLYHIFFGSLTSFLIVKYGNKERSYS
ncbi:hypothetical protein MWH28_11935 [Natroniella sulfidigena]|uniref:hypothetical protein n=1 Tax=Natroniella sulfidigena TaxID=723921 RepID=UPI00200AC5BB|nr:hypothetical protein [Natroniella sulfidigena]MCK8818068.1 hypothetical protein [Natroniella sulfidigena]